MEHPHQPTSADQAHSMMQALQEFRHERERESSEFAAEFQRLDTAQKDCLALLESATLAPILTGCSTVLQGRSVRLIWLQTLSNGRIAACFSAAHQDMEHALRRGKETAAAYDSTTQAVLLPQPPEELRRRLLGWPHTGIPTAAPHHRLSTSPNTRHSHPTPHTIIETAHLLEMTDDELRRMAVTLSPQLGRAGLNAMRKEELVDLCRHLQHTESHAPHI